MSSYPEIGITELVDEPASLSVKDSAEVWSGKIVSVHTDTVCLDDSLPPVHREYVKHPGAVAVVPLRVSQGREQVLMIRQYRHPVRAFLWEFPAGLLDVKNEDYLAAAQRELAEETDLKAETWDVLVDYFASPGGHTESLRIYLARDLTPLGEKQNFHREEEEALFEWGWVDLETAVDAVYAGQIHNPSAVAGTLATYLARERGWNTLRSTNSDWLR